MSKKAGKGGRRSPWMSKEILAKLKQKEEVYSMWKKGQATWEEHMNVVRVCRDVMWIAKSKVHIWETNC